MASKVKCDLCDKLLFSRNMSKHMATKHQGKKPFPCTHCEESFTTTAFLKSHVQTFCIGRNKEEQKIVHDEEKEKSPIGQQSVEDEVKYLQVS